MTLSKTFKREDIEKMKKIVEQYEKETNNPKPNTQEKINYYTRKDKFGMPYLRFEFNNPMEYAELLTIIKSLYIFIENEKDQLVLDNAIHFLNNTKRYNNNHKLMVSLWSKHALRLLPIILQAYIKTGKKSDLRFNCIDNPKEQ